MKEITTTLTPIPFFNYAHFYQSQEQDLLDVFKDVGGRGAFILQKDCTDFEKHLENYTGAKHALGVANGTDALFIALKCAGVGPVDEVIFCSHTFVATASAIHFSGATPVPVECGSDHLIDPNSVEMAITSKTKVIMPTQLNGRVANMDKLQDLAKKHHLIIIEDAAQGLGARFKGKMAGTFGLAGTISFYPAKTLGCLGDGGAILTNDDSLYEDMKKMRDHGRDETGAIVSWGLNSRLDNLQAAFLDMQLGRFGKVVERRREMAMVYHRRLRHLKQLVLPCPPDDMSDHFEAYQNYEIRAINRDGLKVHLKNNGVGTLIQWGGKAVHQIKELGFSVSLPYTEHVFEECLLLPFNMSLRDADIAYVCTS